MHVSVKSVKECHITEHALERWNARVGPVIEDVESLEKLMGRYLQEPDRMNAIRRGCIVFDDEIVAGCSTEGETLIIETFFGRASLRPTLHNHEALSHFVSRQGYRKNRNSALVRTISDEGINLTLRQDELEKAEMPFMTDHLAYARVGSNTFKLESIHNAVRITQVGGNVGVGQVMTVTPKTIHEIWTKSVRGSMSHIHTAKLAASVLDFVEAKSTATAANPACADEGCAV